MSNHVASLVRRRRTGLGPTAKAVLLLLADIASDDGSGIWASKQTLANELELSKRAFQNAIAALVEAGLLSEAGMRSHSNGKTIEYRIEVSVVRSLPETKVPKAENTGAGDAPVPATSSGYGTTCTGAADAPVNEMHVTRARGAPQDVHEVHPNHPKTPLEPSRRRSAPEAASRSSDSDELPEDCSDDDLLAEVMHVSGVDRGSSVPSYWRDSSAIVFLRQWRELMAPAGIIECAHLTRRNFSEPPDGPKALDKPMRRHARALQAKKIMGSDERRKESERDRSYLDEPLFPKAAGDKS